MRVTSPIGLALVVLALVLSGGAAWGQGRAFDDDEAAAATPAPVEQVLTKAPTLKTFVDAEYPEAAKAAKRTATVQLIITLDAAGAVTAVDLAGEPAGDGFDEAAIAAAKAFEFTPAEINGVPSALRVPFTYRFVLTEEAPPPEVQAAQELARVVGRVREKGSGLGVAAAPVGVVALGREVMGDAKGNFVFDGLPPGDVEIVATSPDHRREVVNVTLKAGEEVRIDFRLERLRTSPYETIVRGEREQTSLTRRTLEREQLRTVPGTFGDPLRAIQNMPGLARAPYVIGVLLVRGTTPGDSVIMIDGHEVPLLFHFLGGPSVLPPEILERIDFYPGNFSARYGRAIGGVVDVTTRLSIAKEWTGSADIDLFDIGGYVEGPITDDLSFAFGARRSYVDGVIRLVDAFTEDDIATVLPAYYDYQGRLIYRLDRKNTLAVTIFGSFDDLEVVGDTGNDAGTNQTGDASITFHRLKFDWRSKPSKDVEIDVSPVVGIDRTAFDAGDVAGSANLWAYGLRVDVRWQAAKELVLRTGLDVLGRYVTLAADIPLLIPEYRAYPGSNPGDRTATELERSLLLNGTALYVETEWRPGAGPVTLIPGVRVDSYIFGNEHRLFVDPRLNVRYAVDDKFTLKGGVGIFSQNPLEWRLDPDFGNPDLSLEWAEHYALGFELKLTEAISFDGEFFLSLRNDLSERSEDVSVSAGDDLSTANVTLQRFANSGAGRAYGFELLVKHEMTKRFYGWISYTLSRTETRLNPDEPFRPFVLDQTHNFIAVASYKFAEGWEAGMRFRLTSGNLTTSVVGATFDSDWGQYRPMLGDVNDTRTEPFHQLDVRIERTWAFEAWKLALYLDVQNVYNATNAEFRTFDYRFRESAPVPGLPILPTFGLQGRF